MELILRFFLACSFSISKKINVYLIFYLYLYKIEGPGEGAGVSAPRQIYGVIAKPYVILPEVSPLVVHYEMTTTAF